MKHRLLSRIIISYIAFGLIGFASIPTIIAKNVEKHLSVILSGQAPEVIIQAKYDLLDTAYLTFLVLFALSFIILIVYLISIFKPLKRIANTAEHYSTGEYDAPIQMHRDDEIGYIANTMDYMALELNSLEEDQRKFISNVSHDFRSPLTSIKGYAEAMADGVIPPEMQDKYLNIIIFETQRLEKLTQSLLELNKYGPKGTMLDITSFDINQLIIQTTETFEGQMSEKNLSFDLSLIGTNPLVKADSSKIDQVLHNLIDNAVKFSDYDAKIRIETTVKGGKVFVSVKDYGIGIPKDSLNKVWDRFYKTDLSRGKDKKGTGLGLSIVKEIINAHKENINVISTEGVGTEFIFSLTLSGYQQK